MMRQSRLSRFTWVSIYYCTLI